MQKLCCVRTRQQFSASLDYFVTSSPPYLHQFSTISGGNCITDAKKDTSFAGVHDKVTSFAAVPVPKPNTTVATNTDNLDTESNHNSVDPNVADDNSSKASVHSTGSHICIHSATSEPPQHPLDEEANLSEDQTKLDDIELCELETQVPILH